MKTVILDENLPVVLRHFLKEFTVVTVYFKGWAGVQNGQLIQLIDSQYDVFVTADSKLRYQQNLLGRKISIVEIPLIQKKDIPRYIDRIVSAVHDSEPGGYIKIQP